MRSAPSDLASCCLAYARGVMKCIPPNGSDGVAAALAGADADRIVDRRDEDLPVADATRAGRLDDGVDDGGGLGVVDQDLELHLRQELHAVLGTAIELG